MPFRGFFPGKSEVGGCPLVVCAIPAASELPKNQRGEGILGENLFGWSFRVRGLCSKPSQHPLTPRRNPPGAVPSLGEPRSVCQAIPANRRKMRHGEGDGWSRLSRAEEIRREPCPSRLHGFSTKADLDLGICSLWRDLQGSSCCSRGAEPSPPLTALPRPFQGCDSQCCTGIHMSLQEETGKSWSRTKKQMQAGTTGRVHQKTGEDVPSRNS